jgi:hypothetical protein
LYYGKVIRKSWKMLDLVVPVEQLDLKDLKSKRSHSIGVSNKIQYLLASKKIKVHDDYVLSSLDDVPFREHSFDAINVSGVLEYMPKHEGEVLLEKLERIGDKIIVKLPNNGFPITFAYKTYKSIWHAEDLKRKGYKVRSYGIYSPSFLVRELTKLLVFLKWAFTRFSLFIIGIKEE